MPFLPDIEEKACFGKSMQKIYRQLLEVSIVRIFTYQRWVKVPNEPSLEIKKVSLLLLLQVSGVSEKPYTKVSIKFASV
jgi:hypothetical protein